MFIGSDIRIQGEIKTQDLKCNQLFGKAQENDGNQREEKENAAIDIKNKQIESLLKPSAEYIRN
ncbi:MAG: hypothetical protein JXA72_10540 [Bacteroidales bacterium]|nr:hypothetical protein [Bacteroidales bacterium]